MQIEHDETMMSEDAAEQSDIESRRLVPVTESIRYRRRAQSAEKKAESLAEELAQTRVRIAEMDEKLNNVQLEQTLAKKLAAAGAVDLEAAVLVAKARLGKGAKSDLDECVVQLKKEKQYLFCGVGGNAVSYRTAGLKDRNQSSNAGLERAAKRAVRSGSRTDLQEYLRLRRNVL